MLGFQSNRLSTVSTFNKRFVGYLLNPLTVASVTDTEKGSRNVSNQGAQQSNKLQLYQHFGCRRM